jgi:glycosyltransferase involved in cell wall biosynthesis
MNPLVSIIVPVYNKAPYINQGLESLIAQTYKDIEIICVDNNSTDDSLKIVKEWERKYPQLIKVIDEKKQGAPCARNAGTNLAKGEWIQYFDVDDYLYPDKIEHQIKLIQKLERPIDIVFEGWEVVNMRGNKKRLPLLEDVWKALYIGRLGHTNSVLITKQKILEVGGWNESRKSSQERDLFFRILKTNPGYVTSDNFGSIFQMRENSITTSRGSEKANTIRYVQLRQNVLDYIIENHLDKFNKEKSWYLSIFNEWLRHLYPYDPELSIQLYNQYCKGQKIVPVGSLKKIYLFFLKLFGFSTTERLYTVVSKIRK